MNLILLDTQSEIQTLAHHDPRARHLLEILRPEVGTTIDVGVPNGPRGKALIAAVDPDSGWRLEIEWREEPPLPEPVHLVIGLPRPQTARKVLHTATSMGFRGLHFFASEKGEPSYGQSKLWSTREWERLCHEGAAQAFTTWIPEVTHAPSLDNCLRETDLQDAYLRLALDLYEAEADIRQLATWSRDAVLAIGPERGWSNAERQTLRRHGFRLASLGERVLRTETACAVAMGCLLMGRR